MYSPKPYKEWQAEAAKALKSIAWSSPTSGPVEVTIECLAARPKTTKLPHPKPDVDNYAKAILDAITKDGRFWTDDSQVQRLTVSKAWTTEAPLIRLTIKEL
jgi:Holliday junction resolvase RusA-like endonuclease